ncbi:hypothetical protein D8674_007202 [Pyrus ussuriensis x Pyrus communis]|uniref:Uncharacterized protein n=1 Tax=Pyrus ussuriensis x Pyrus communis TaxID=2448454 RepID=A0A5N5FWI0_9ROSA|nr:hypothetical protein D8674_007202 [Pyrus ussuriensis x Pyrus communis]
MNRFCAKIIQLLNALIISPVDRDHPEGKPDLEAAVPQVPNRRKYDKFPANNLDWAKIIVGFCFTTAIGLAFICFQIPPDQLPLPVTFDFLGLSVLLAFTCILVSKSIHFGYSLFGISIAGLSHHFGLFFGVTAFFISISIPFPFWFKCATYSIYVAAFILVLLFNLHFNKHYKPRVSEHLTPNNSIPPTAINPAVESSRGGTSIVDDQACTSSTV